MQKKTRKSKCKFCSTEFVKTNPLNPYCRPLCEIQANAQRKREKEQKVKVKKEKIKTKKSFSRSKLIEEADKVWSLYIRNRDIWNPCITCETPWKDTHQAGHFMSRRYLNTRWEKLNGASQCPQCNCWGAGEQYLFSLALDRKRKWLAEDLRKIALSTEKVSNDEILEYTRLYYRLLSEMQVDYKPKKMYQAPGEGV